MLLIDPSICARKLLLCVCLLAISPAGLGAQGSYQEILLAVQQRIESHDLEGARSLIAKAQNRFPANGGIENLLGVVEVQQGNRDGAKQAFAAAIRHDPKLVGAYLNLARLLLETRGDSREGRAEALNLYDRVLRIEPQSAEANYQAATLLMGSEQYVRSLAHLNHLSAADRDRIGPLVVRCADEAALGHKEAANRAADALAANPDLSEQDVLMALPALRTARRADLLETLLSAVEKRAQLSAGALRILGLAQEAEGKLGQARSTLERAYSGNPAGTAVLSDLARVAEELKDYQSALGYLAHARDLEPSNAAISYEFGLDCLKLKLIEEARKAVAEAVQKAPDVPEYNYTLGMITATERDPMEALPFIRKYHDLRPADPAGDLALGTVFFRAKDYDAAVPWLKRATAHAQTAASAFFFLARIDRERGDLEQALQELEEASKLQQDDPDVLAERGQINVQRKRFEDAARELSKALAIDPDNYAANFGLLQLYVRTADPRRAEQSSRFDLVKQKNEQMSREMMREIQVDSQLAHPPAASDAGASVLR